VPTKYPLSQDRIVVSENRLHSKNPMLYRPAFHGNWNALSLARRAIKDKFSTPTVPLTTVLQNRQVFLPDPILMKLVGLIKMIWTETSTVTCFVKSLEAKTVFMSPCEL
jgi:hypothetical protein